MGETVAESAFPVRPEQLTVSWLEGLIRDKGDLAAGQHLVSFTFKPVGEVMGLLGEVVRVYLTYSTPGAGPASLVIKFAHKLAENRQIGNNTDMYRREVQFLNDVAPLVDMPLAKTYFAQMDPVTGGNAVVVRRGHHDGADDVDHLAGGELLDGDDVADVRCVRGLDALAVDVRERLVRSAGTHGPVGEARHRLHAVVHHDRRRHGDHRLDGVAPGDEDVAPGTRRGEVRRGDGGGGEGFSLGHGSPC